MCRGGWLLCGQTGHSNNHHNNALRRPIASEDWSLATLSTNSHRIARLSVYTRRNVERELIGFGEGVDGCIFGGGLGCCRYLSLAANHNAAIVLACAQQRTAKHLPFAWFLIVPLTLGVLLRLLYAMEFLPFPRDWLINLAEVRPITTILASELLSGEQGAEGIYLTLLVGEVATAACVLYLSARPGMWALSVQHICDDFASKRVKSGVLGLFFILLAAGLCWALPGSTIGSRRIDYYSIIFFPVAPLATCVFAAFGWKMLFAERPNPATNNSKS